MLVSLFIDRPTSCSQGPRQNLFFSSGENNSFIYFSPLRNSYVVRWNYFSRSTHGLSITLYSEALPRLGFSVLFFCSSLVLALLFIQSCLSPHFQTGTNFILFLSDLPRLILAFVKTLTYFADIINSLNVLRFFLFFFNEHYEERSGASVVLLSFFSLNTLGKRMCRFPSVLLKKKRQSF